jgi:hypothetical protein
MELQNKFEEIIAKQRSGWEFERNKEVAKECTIICLEEQIKILNKLSNYQSFSLSNEIEELQQQLKLLKDGNKTTE